MSESNTNINNNNTNEELDKILNTKLILYSYMTEDYEPGTILTSRQMEKCFDQNALFQMENPVKKVFTIGELLKKGFMSGGSTDLMETLDLTIPLIGNDKPVIKGLYMHGSRKIIKLLSGIDFKMDPESEPEDNKEDELVEFD